nr:pentatricopeptide repeat-containing protein [Tanacetum cinerariifolium]
MLDSIGFNCLYLISEPIVPHFILEFYSQVQLSYNEDSEMSIIFIIRGQCISYNFFEFVQILRIPSEGQCSFTDEWSPDLLLREQYLSGPYHIELPNPEDIRMVIQIERTEHTCLIKGLVTYLNENQILTKEIKPNMKTWVDIIRENAFCIGGNRDHIPACLAHMLYCVATSTQ